MYWAGQSALSYLNIPSLLSAAEITESDAIHPGYGFLAENSEFASLCRKWKLIFIGPSAELIEQMGDKIRSKALAEKAGLPVLKSVNLTEDLSKDSISQQAEALGFPLLIKASAGGGGRGMRRVNNLNELHQVIPLLKQEALRFFGRSDLFIEKYIESPRHIEVQILGDRQGNIVHLGERDCTIQRRFQKLIEEAPANILSHKKRDQICADAVALARSLNYESAGTVEFLYDSKSQNHYFMEMNTRIQVEHPVTEQRCGIDLVAEQIKIANDQPLSFVQDEIKFHGHVLEMRINAEDSKTFHPCPGLVSHYHRPGGLGVRVDDFIYTGYTVPPFYDSMLAKIIVNARDRKSCLARASRALEETVVGGLGTNIDLHKQILEHPDFIRNDYSTHFISDKFNL